MTPARRREIHDAMLRFADGDRVAWAITIAAYELMTARRQHGRRREQSAEVLIAVADGRPSPAEHLCGGRPMVDLDALARRARRTAEWSRARMACRIAVAVAALAIAPLVGGGEPLVGACLAVALFVAAALLRWRNQIGVDAVRDGLVLGAVPLVAALVLGDRGAACGALGTAELACALAGAVAGVGVTWRARRAPTPHARRWLLTLLVASMTAALGCRGASNSRR